MGLKVAVFGGLVLCLISGAVALAVLANFRNRKRQQIDWVVMVLGLLAIMSVVYAAVITFAVLIGISESPGGSGW